MKRKLMIIVGIILLALTSTIVSYAATAKVELKVDKAEVKVGDTFTVTLRANCSNGINGVITTYSYDENKLEYVSEKVVDSKNFAFIGDMEAKEIFVYANSKDSIKEADVYALTFRVKESASVGSTAKISIAETTLDSDAATNSENILGKQEIAVTIVEDAPATPQPAKLSGIKVETKPNKTNYVVGENFNTTGMVIKAKYEDGTEKNVTNYTITNGSNLDAGQKYVTISYTEGGITKTTTQEITVSEKNQESSAPMDIVKFEILSKPNKLQYIKDKEQLDITGGKLKLTYDDNSTKELDFSHVEVQVIGFDNTKVGKNLITVLYRNETASFYIDIVEESNPGGATNPGDDGNEGGNTGAGDDQNKGDNSGNGDNTGTGENSGTGNNNSAGGNAGSNNNAATKEDALSTEKEYPKAGLNKMLSLGVIAIVVLIIMYRKNQKYRDIK